MADPAFDPTGAPPDLGEVVNQVAGGQPAPQAAQPAQPLPQPTPPPPPQPPPPPPVPQQPQAQPQAPQPAPDRPYAFGEEPWRQQPPQPPQPGEQPPLQPAAPQEPPDFLSYVSGKGLDLSQFGENADPQKVVDHLLEQATSAEQYRRQLQFLQQQQQPEQPPAAQPEPAAPEPARPTGTEPPVLSDADRWVMKGLENGTIKQEDLLPQQRASIAAWADWRAKRAEALVDRPMEVIQADVEKYLADQGFVRKDQMDALMQEAKEKEFTAELNQMYGPYFHVTGENGQPVVDPATGQERLSEWGWKFVEAREYFSKTCGITNPVRLAQAIIRSIGEPVQPDATPTPKPSGNGATPPAVAPQPAATPQQGFVQAATQAATEFPSYPTADRGGVQGQPLLGTSPTDMTPPDINAVAQELLGPAAHGWR